MSHRLAPSVLPKKCTGLLSVCLLCVSGRLLLSTSARSSNYNLQAEASQEQNLEFSLKSCMARNEANGQSPGLPSIRCLLSRQNIFVLPKLFIPGSQLGY